MAYLLLFGRLADARRARPRRFRLFNAHLDEYLSEKEVKSRFRFGRDSINYLLCNGFPCFSFGLISHTVSKLKARLHRRFLSQQLDAIFAILNKLQLQNRTCKPGVIFSAICRRNIGNRNVKPNKRINE